MFKVGDEVSVMGEIVAVNGNGVVVKAHYFGEAYFDNSNIDVLGKTYSQGLADAWELAKKIALPIAYGGITSMEMKKIFGESDHCLLLKNFTAAEALAKIEAYEKEKEIKVGSIVKDGEAGGLGVVTSLHCYGRVYVMWYDGSCGLHEKDDFINTGRMAEGLDLLLRQIGE